MSVELVFDLETEDETSFALATNTGWQDFSAWASGLAAESPNLNRLLSEGWTTDLDILRRELTDGLTESHPQDDVGDTARVLLRLIEGVESEAVIAVDQ